MMTNEQAQDIEDNYVPLTDAVRRLVREGVEINDQILRRRAQLQQIKAKLLAGRWWVLTSELTRIVEKEGQGS